MFIVFRADASHDIGHGHVMRCLALADALRLHGARCHFVAREHRGNLNAHILARGHGISVLSLPSATGRGLAEDRDDGQGLHAHWLGVTPQEDAMATAEALSGLGLPKADWFVVDHYALDGDWERSMRGAYRHLMAIDDLADRHHDCDVILDQNLGRSACDYAGLVPERSHVLTGPSYALLRPQFAAARARSLARRSPPRLERLLITMGGVDRPHLSGAVLDALSRIRLPVGMRITVVMGMNAPWIDAVRTQALAMPAPTEVLVGVEDMAGLMADADLAIGAAGSTSWERCCLGLPAVQLVIAANQAGIARALHQAGAALQADPDELVHVLGTFLDPAQASLARLAAMSRAASEVADGRGCERVVNLLKKGTP